MLTPSSPSHTTELPSSSTAGTPSSLAAAAASSAVVTSLLCAVVPSRSAIVGALLPQALSG